MSDVILGLIDSGVDPQRHAPVASRSFVLQDDRVCPGPAQRDRLGHGRAVADILLARQPELPLHSAQVFVHRLTCSAQQVAAALDWLVEGGVTLVNMSFGLRSDRPVLREACERADSAGVTLIAAAPARGDAVYPAAYPFVLRATGDARCQVGEISFLGTDEVACGGRVHFGGHVRCGDGRVAGASVGCAHVTRCALGLLLENPGMDRAQLYSALVKRASYRGPERRRS